MGKDFGWAIDRLKNGYRVCREGWNGKPQWLEVKRPYSDSDMSVPYIFICTVQGDLVPWLASQADMLGEDWLEYTL